MQRNATENRGTPGHSDPAVRFARIALASCLYVLAIALLSLGWLLFA